MSREKRPPIDPNTVWTPANVVTLVRICLVPVFVAAILSPWPTWFPESLGFESLKPWVAAAVFAFLALTDGVDGYLARSRNEVTNFGKFMDPLADKILVVAALIALVELRVLPSWPVLIIIAREFIVSGMRMMAATSGTVVAASWYGKAKTVTQIIAIILFILKDSLNFVTIQGALASPMYVVSWLVMIASLVLTIVSMLDYFWKVKHLMGFGAAPESEVTAKPVSDKDIAELAQKVVNAAIEKNVQIATAESLTGGLISGALTSVPGSSAVVRGAVVSYSSDVKRDVLEVNERVIEEQSAVCETVALEMANHVRVKLEADVAVSVTGIAGPGGEMPGKPVGTVWMGVSTDKGSFARLFTFQGDREQVRKCTVYEALRAIEKSI